MALTLRNTLATVFPNAKGLPNSYRVDYKLNGDTRQEQLEDIVHLAYHVYEGMSFLFDTDGCPGMSHAFTRIFSLIFRFEGFTDDEVYNRLLPEARRKYR